MEAPARIIWGMLFLVPHRPSMRETIRGTTTAGDTAPSTAPMTAPSTQVRPKITGASSV